MGNRAFFDREERFPGLAIEQEEVAHLRRLRDGRDRPALLLHVEKRRLGSDVVVPEIVMTGLEAPDRLPRLAIASNSSAI